MIRRLRPLSPAQSLALPVPRILLHVGAPKCGSSVLQAALSAAPRLEAADGARLAYTAAQDPLAPALPGRRVARAARRAVHGYVHWPGCGPQVTEACWFAALDRQWPQPSGAVVPVLSNEGWIDKAAGFARHLPHWFDGTRRIDLLAAVRPPLEWLNAAWWQWGVWTGADFDAWLDGRMMPYRLGSALAEWQALPGVRLSVITEPDVLAGAETRLGVTLPRPAMDRNSALPPAGVGFLLRNRRFRPTPHDSRTEFVLQRWCRWPDTWAARPWALRPEHVLRLRAPLRAEVDRLFALLPGPQAEAALAARPGWLREAPYHALMRAPQARLHDPEDLVTLHGLLCDGVRRASRAAGRALPGLPGPPGTAGPHALRDAPVAAVLDALLERDAAWRNRRRRVA